MHIQHSPAVNTSLLLLLRNKRGGRRRRVARRVGEGSDAEAGAGILGVLKPDVGVICGESEVRNHLVHWYVWLQSSCSPAAV